MQSLAGTGLRSLMDQTKQETDLTEFDMRGHGEYVQRIQEASTTYYVTPLQNLVPTQRFPDESSRVLHISERKTGELVTERPTAVELHASVESYVRRGWSEVRVGSWIEKRNEPMTNKSSFTDVRILI